MTTNSNKYKGLVSDTYFNIICSIFYWNTFNCKQSYIPCNINTKSTTIRVNGRFIIPRMGKKVLFLLLILHVVFFVAAAVIIIVIFDVFVTSQKMGLVILNFTYPSFLMNFIYIF